MYQLCSHQNSWWRESVLYFMKLANTFCFIHGSSKKGQELHSTQTESSKKNSLLRRGLNSHESEAFTRAPEAPRLKSCTLRSGSQRAPWPCAAAFLRDMWSRTSFSPGVLTHNIRSRTAEQSKLLTHASIWGVQEQEMFTSAW